MNSITRLFFYASLFVISAVIALNTAHAEEIPLNIGSKLELFVDCYMIERMEGTELKLHTPCLAGTALIFDKPWEGAFCGYVTVIKDGEKYRMYYRGLPVSGKDGTNTEVTCYAESDDGMNFTKPNIGIYEVNGTKDNNVVLSGFAPCSHNFCPFLDGNIE